jgi:hypothetical protein
MSNRNESYREEMITVDERSKDLLVLMIVTCLKCLSFPNVESCATSPPHSHSTSAIIQFRAIPTESEYRLQYSPRELSHEQETLSECVREGRLAALAVERALIRMAPLLLHSKHEEETITLSCRI